MRNGVQFIGGYRPVETYLNGGKIAGSVLDEQTGADLQFSKTYNHKFNSLTLYGAHSQAQSEQSANYFDWRKWVNTGVNTQIYYSFDIHGNLSVLTNDFRYNVDACFLRLSPNTTYSVSTETITRLQAFDSAGNTLGEKYPPNPSGKLTFITDSNGKTFFKFGSSYAPQELGRIMLSEGNTLVPFTPFIPDSPSPDYPSPIVPANGKMYVDDENERSQQITLPDLYGEGGVRDEWNALTGEGVRRWLYYEFDGTENWECTIDQNDETNPTAYLYCEPSFVTSNPPPAPTMGGNCVSSHYGITVTPSGEHAIDRFGITSSGICRLRINKSTLGIDNIDTSEQRVAKLKSWLANEEIPFHFIWQPANAVAFTFGGEDAQTYYPETNIWTDAEVKPAITAAAKIIG